MLPRSSFDVLQGSVNDDESESLQADVMRFMAILGLCLMVIFALVQSLPSVGESRESVREREAERAAQAIEIAELRQQLGELGANNRAIQEQLQQYSQTIDSMRNTAADPREVQAQLQQYEQTIESLNAQLVQNQNIETRVRVLTEQRDQLQSDIQRSEQQRKAQQAQVQAQVSEIASLKSRLAQLEQRPEAEIKPEPVTDPASESELEADSTTEPTPEEGFRLTFASNEAFFRLVQTGEIDVFMITPERQGYQLSRDGQALLSSPLPRQIQDINKASLPPALLGVLSRQRLPSSSRWGVVLSSRVMQGIDQARTGASGGTLLIDGSAGVTLK